VRGYKEEGTTTTPFDMCVLNEIDRFHLAIDVIDRVPKVAAVSAHLRQQLRNKLMDHREYVHKHGEDMPEVQEWKWPAA
jgi:xylulose-5-phosphate/fructose-6-phosphate phosphoketolase